MIRIATSIALISLLLPAGFARADAFDDCRVECRAAEAACINGITLYDETGIKEAKAACNREYAGCDKTCHDIDTMGGEEFEKLKKKEAEDAERKKKEQEIVDRGNIRLYDEDSQGRVGIDSGGIKSYQGGEIRSYDFSNQ